MDDKIDSEILRKSGKEACVLSGSGSIRALCRLFVLTASERRIRLNKISENERILISGYAKLPAHITSEEVFKTMVVVAVIDPIERIIVDAECSLVTDVARKFVTSLMVGCRMDDGPDELLEKFDRTYFGQTKSAVKTAIKMIYLKYADLNNE